MISEAAVSFWNIGKQQVHSKNLDTYKSKVKFISRKNLKMLIAQKQHKGGKVNPVKSFKIQIFQFAIPNQLCLNYFHSRKVKKTFVLVMETISAAFYICKSNIPRLDFHKNKN